MSEVLVRPPAHPVPSLQGPFEESMVESVNEIGENETPPDASTRRAMLLDSPYYERIVAGRWRQRPGEKYHPLWKLISQMAFGLHLLARNMAKSEDEVMKILQAHVDDIDSFLECTGEDLELAQEDLHERLRCLKLPLQHGDVFDRMLRDSGFRESILEGNRKIEHIVSRTKRFLKDSLKDVRKGFDATSVLERYVHGLTTAWQRQTPEHEAVFVAMIGNVEGWRKAFMDLHLQGNRLAGTMKKLTEVVREMTRRANSVTEDPMPISRSMASIDRSDRPSSARSNRDQSLDASSPFTTRSADPSSAVHTPTPLSSSTQVEESSTSPVDRTVSEEELAFELPADVPEDLLRSAPVSVRNRLSYTLGLQKKQHSDRRISSIYYPKALGALLKLPHTPSKEMPSPISTPEKKSGTVRPVSPQTASDGDNDQSPVQRALGRSATVIQRNALRKPSILTPGQSPGLCSHPAVMAIVERPPPPVELPAQPSPGLPESRTGPQEPSKSPPESSLGEPGPEVEESQPVSERVKDLTAEASPSPSPVTPIATDLVSIPVHSVIKSNKTSLSEVEVYELGTGEEVTTPTRIPQPASPPPIQEPDLAAEDSDEKAQSKLEAVKEESTTTTDEGAHEDKTATKEVSDASSPSTLKAAERNEETRQEVIAELEATVPQPSTTVTPERAEDIKPNRAEDIKPSQQHTELPSPTTVSDSRASDNRDKATSGIQQRIEWLSLKQKALKNRSAKEWKQTRPLRLKLTRLDGKMVPVQVHTPQTAEATQVREEPEPIVSTVDADVISSMIEQISSTPVGSPAHTRVGSTAESPASSESVPIHSRRTSRQLGPPESAPPPPAPGGRAMVQPDFAAAGEFDGELKSQHKRNSGGGSRSGVKNFLRRNSSRRTSSDLSIRSEGPSTTWHSQSARGSGSDTVTTVTWAGKEAGWGIGGEDAGGVQPHRFPRAERDRYSTEIKLQYSTGPGEEQGLQCADTDRPSVDLVSFPHRTASANVAPWDQPSNGQALAPWEQDPKSQLLGTASVKQEADQERRPSAASANTASTTEIPANANGSRHRKKNLKGFFGDSPSDSPQKGSTINLSDQTPSGSGSESASAKLKHSASAQAQTTLDDGPKTAAPPSRTVTPWDYQNFDDVSNFGSAPVRESIAPESSQYATKDKESSASARRGFLHRHTRSSGKDDSSKGKPPAISEPLGLSSSREAATTNVARNIAQQPPQMSSGNGTPLGGPASADRRASTTKRSLFSKLKDRHKDKNVAPEPARPTYEAPKQQPQTPQDSKKSRGTSFLSSGLDRDTGLNLVDNGSTIKPAADPAPFSKLDKTTTASSKTSKWSRPSRNRGQSVQSDVSAKAVSAKAAPAPTLPQSTMPAGIFSLDTNFDDMSDIISKPAGAEAPADVVAAPGVAAATPAPAAAAEVGTPAWDAPDSWAVKDTQENLAEVDEEGLPPIDEEDGISYFMRVFRADGTFATLSMTINATVSEVLQTLAKKSVLHDSIENYQFLMRKHQLSRELKSSERPIAMQKKLLQQAGYDERDHIDEIGREDNSYLVRFTFSHEKHSGYGSGLDNDPNFNKAQKFSHVDLSGKSLITIPITLYLKAAEIVSLNLSRNLALSVPKDFITACTNLREIKFTGNEALRLPSSLAWAGRLTVLDISNNRLEQLDHAELHRLIGLVSLKLANNNLSTLPSNFGSFRALRSLNISSNNFTRFPEQIINLKGLVDLDISFNKLSQLPQISQMTTLERVWLTNNDLKGPFNESVKSLVNLKEIDARFNGFTNLDSLTALPNLETLLVGHNNVTTFKGSFKKLRVFVLDHNPLTAFQVLEPMPTLVNLNLGSGKLVELNEAMFDLMPALQRLNLDKNHLSNMSPQIGRLSKLEYFSMAKNPLNLIPPSIGNLVELKYLNIRECNVKSLPPEIWFCRKLETLNVSSNVLETFPKQIAPPPPPDLKDPAPATPVLSQSPSFEELGKLENFQARRPSQASAGMLSVGGSSPGGAVRKNSLASLPGQQNRKMSTITRTNTETSLQSRMQNTFAGSLRYLYLADNRLEDEVFRELVQLPELRVLNLSYNELDDFPQGVLKRWPQLQELYLSGNELTSLPTDDLTESCNLKALHLNANRFQVLPAELCNVHKLAVLDVGSNSLKYNVSNWPYDWNWNRNTNLKYLNFSANKRLEIKPAAQHNQMQFNAMTTSEAPVDLTSFNSLKYLRVLGLMDVTLLTNTIPEDNEDRRVRTSASMAGALMYGMADTLGRSDHLATLDLLKPNFRGHDSEILVAMFDGETMSHGGSRISKYLHENFAATFVDELTKTEEEEKATAIDALRRTFLSLNKDMANFANSNFDAREHRLATGHRASIANSLGPDDLNSGGTATVLFINGTELFVANVGDIQAILIQSNGQHRELTQKHDPAEPSERERIRAAGGYVSRQGKLNEALEVSRAFGYYNHMPSVMAAPYTLNCQLGDSDELIVLATREFWEFVTVDLAVDVARADKSDLMLAAQKLRDLAIAFGARDKIMVMVLGVSDLRKRAQSRFRGTSLSMAKELGGGDDSAIFPSSRKSRRKGEVLVGDSRLARLDEPEAPVGELAICFTDIKNSTALWEVQPVPMRSAIIMHNELMRRQLRIIGGYEVKTEGDAFMVAFPTVTSAMLWCFSCQVHLLELEWPTEILNTVHCQEKFDPEGNTIYRGLSVRMGIHWGRPVCEQDPITRRMDYFGPMVNKSARVSAVADGGQITVSSDFITEVQRTLEQYADEERRDSVGSEDTMNDDPMANQIRRELRQLSSQGFEVKDLGEKKLKGLENPEYIYLMFPHSLVGRLNVPPGADPPKPGAAPEAEPGALAKDTELGHLEIDDVWKLWDIALRLEMLCSCLESPEKSRGLNKPELSLLNHMKTQGGVVSDQFMVNLFEHQVTRIETCITTIQLRNMLQPFKKGASLVDQAVPISHLLNQVASLLKKVDNKSTIADADRVTEVS
ncbi:hypothetical protein DV738_g1709, partial [Chaetothyriales sp. CBS 135597]